MKGSVACMLAAAEQFRAADLKKAVYITCTADEEVGYVGAGQVVERSELFREMADADVRGIVGEPTRLNVVYAHKGTYGFRAISHGRAAHSSTREGLNANLAMIPFLVEMKQIHDETEASADWQNDEFDPPTISWNIGVNDHTHAINVKAPQSICTVYFRPMPGQDPELLMDRVRAAAKTHGVELQVAHRGNPLYTPRDSAFVTEVLQLADRESPRTVSYGTDGGTFCQRMKQLVVIGPGDIAQAHTADEWIELEQLERGTDVYSQMIRTWCCQES